MVEEEISEFADYFTYHSEPWECMYRMVRYGHSKDNIVMKSGLPQTPFEGAQEDVYWTGVFPNTNMSAEFTPRRLKAMVSDFFEKSGAPRYHKLMQHTEKWIVWSVMKGRYRMDRCKRMWEFTGHDGSCRVLNLKHGSHGFWKRVSDTESYSILEAITDHSNDLIDALLKKVKRHPNGRKVTDYYKCCVENFKNLHKLRLKMYDQAAASCLTPLHRQRRWFYQQKRLAPAFGGGRAKVAHSEPLPVPSVHQILKMYHLWLPLLR